MTTLFIESTPVSFNTFPYATALIALSDGSFVTCDFTDFTAKRWLISTTVNDENKNINNSRALKQIGTFIGHTDSVLSAVEKDANSLITVSLDETMKEWNIRTCECLMTINLHKKASNLLRMTKDKSKVLLECCDGRFEFRRASDLSHIITLKIHPFPAQCCCELDDGTFVSATFLTMQRWDESGKVLQTFSSEHSDNIFRIIELSNGTIVTTSKDETLNLWKVSSGECLHCLTLHQSRVFELVKLSRDKFVSWGLDSTMRVWTERLDCIETIPVEGYATITNRVGNDIVAISIPIDSTVGLITFRRLK